ncbi:MAG: hypothetical protein COT74_06120 [Bdellovibrionales bacterium CG10_big_fil_rev_8_21_14_0_10_45_34]|nr:MAG: hypothetical protein COT74_06120 [Bdellovibrionales bacterium CG10_big_fil_rev_8_21_14_0_10_45_34]
MKQNLKKLLDKLNHLEREEVFFDLMPRFFLEGLRKYLRVEVEGLEHLPKRGRALIVPNHSGFAGFDAVILANEIQRSKGRVPRLMAHKLWFMNNWMTQAGKKFGLVEATTDNAREALNRNHLVVLFPEGEEGNFKPSIEKYRLKEFKRGFIRLAVESEAPIIPTVIIGAEETHITLFQIRALRKYFGLIIPIPLNLFPLPARWKIRFLEPVFIPEGARLCEDEESVHDLCESLQAKIQHAIDEELQKRGNPYF